MKKANSRRIACIALGGVILSFCAYYLTNYFQWENIFQVLLGVNLKWLLGAGTCTIVIYWLIRALRWYILLKAVNVHIDFFHLYLVGALSLAFSIMTPMQSGELLKIEFLRAKGVLDRSSGYSTFIAERLFDLIFVILMALLYGISNFIDKSTLPTASFLLIICCVIFFLVISLAPPQKPLGRFIQSIRQCMENGKTVLVVFVLTAGGWLMVAIGWFASLRSISVSISFPDVIGLTSIITMVNLLSLIPGAIGISEVGIASLLIHLHQPLVLAQSGGVILRAYGVLALIIGAIHYLYVLCLKGNSKHSAINRLCARYIRRDPRCH